MEPNYEGMTRGNSGSSPSATGAEQARRIGRSARTRVFSTLDQGKGKLVEQLDGWLGKVPGNVQIPFFSDGVDRVRSFTDGIRDRNAEDVLDDIKFEAHRRPGAFMLGAFAIGFLAARVLRDVGSDT